MQDSAPSTASELGAVLGRGGKETDPHGVSSILWTHLVREPRRKTIRAQKKESDGGHLERSEALARRKVSFLQRQGDTDLHASVRSKAVTDAYVTELPNLLIRAPNEFDLSGRESGKKLYAIYPDK